MLRLTSRLPAGCIPTHHVPSVVLVAAASSMRVKTLIYNLLSWSALARYPSSSTRRFFFHPREKVGRKPPRSSTRRCFPNNSEQMFGLLLEIVCLSVCLSVCVSTNVVSIPVRHTVSRSIIYIVGTYQVATRVRSTWGGILGTTYPYLGKGKCTDTTYPRSYPGSYPYPYLPLVPRVVPLPLPWILRTCVLT